MNIYLLSGLGADKRVFKKLTFSDKDTIHHIAWIVPNQKEMIRDYAQRLIAQIDQTEPFMLIGLSFGGIVAVELCNYITPLKTIIISSTSSANEIPWYYKIVGKLNLVYFIPSTILKAPTALTFWFFGAKNAEQQLLLSKILNDTHPYFLKWALASITTWKQKTRPDNLYHLHGTSDRILPLKYVNPDIKLNGGGHLMILDQHEVITKILTAQLASVNTI